MGGDGICAQESSITPIYERGGGGDFMLRILEVDDTLTFKFSLHINYYRTTNYYRPFIDPQTYIVKSPFLRSNKGCQTYKNLASKIGLHGRLK